MARNKLILAAAVLSVVALANPAAAQNEQFIPILSYRTGAYAVNGVPFANGMRFAPGYDEVKGGRRLVSPRARLQRPQATP